MVGKGKGKKTIRNLPGKAGNGQAKRFRVENKPEITLGGIRRLARRGGVKRISAGIYPEIRDFMDYFMIHAVKNSVVFAESARRKTITILDVVYSLKKLGRTIYGYGP